MNDQQWEKVRSIFEPRGLSGEWGRKIVDERPYEHYDRGDDWVAADGGLHVVGVAVEADDVTELVGAG